MDNLLTSQEAAKIIGIGPETLRRWEESGKLGFKAIRTKGQHRRYPKDQVLLYKQEMLSPPKPGFLTIPDTQDAGNGVTQLNFIDEQGQLASGFMGGSRATAGKFDPNQYAQLPAVKQMQALENPETLSLVSVSGINKCPLDEVFSQRTLPDGRIFLSFDLIIPVSYTHLTLPTT